MSTRGPQRLDNGVRAGNESPARAQSLTERPDLNDVTPLQLGGVHSTSALCENAQRMRLVNDHRCVVRLCQPVDLTKGSLATRHAVHTIDDDNA